MSRIVATAAVAAMSGAVLIAGIAPVAAEDAGPLAAVVNGTDGSSPGGTNFDTVQVTAPAACDPAATRHVLRIVKVTAAKRADQPEADAWVRDFPNLYAPVGVGLPGPLTVSSADSWQGLANRTGQTLVPGTYEFVLRCQDNLGTEIYEEWSGGVEFTSPTKWKRLPVQQSTSSSGVTSAPVTSEGTATANPDDRPTTESGTPSESASEVSSHAGADEDGGSTSVAGSLAETGASVTGVAALAGLLLAGGTGLMVLSRRRRRASTTGPTGR